MHQNKFGIASVGQSICMAERFCQAVGRAQPRSEIAEFYATYLSWLDDRWVFLLTQKKGACDHGPGGHLELPHPWPGQNPPLDGSGTAG